MPRYCKVADLSYLEHAAAVFTAYPWTVHLWARVKDATANYCLFGVARASASTTRWSIEARGGIAGDPFALFSATNEARTTTGYTANVWHSVTAVGRSATDRSIYIDGGSKGDNTTSNTPALIDTTSIGRRAGTAPVYSDADIGPVAVWNVGLTDGEILSLALGLHPFQVRLTALQQYWPLNGDADPEPDLIGNYLMTPTLSPAKIADCPRLFLPDMGALGKGVAVAAGGQPLWMRYGGVPFAGSGRLRAGRSW